jgi:hypothetical protein
MIMHYSPPLSGRNQAQARVTWGHNLDTTHDARKLRIRILSSVSMTPESLALSKKTSSKGSTGSFGDKLITEQI